MWRLVGLLLAVSLLHVQGKIESEQDIGDSGDQDFDDSNEKIGPVVTQVFQHPYAASLLKNNTYLCSAVILNTYWLLTSSKCFDPNVIASYVTYKNLNHYAVRVGSSFNNNGGDISTIKMLITNFDRRVSAIKLTGPLDFSSRVNAVKLPNPDEEVSLGYLASAIAWTPNFHLRLVNMPLIDPTLCEPYTKMLPGHYICVGGVEDPNRHFCRKDNGGAVVQNDTLVGISTFLHTCAVYSKIHAFPKVSGFARWIDSIIWDEDNRPTTPSTTEATTTAVKNVTEIPEDRNTVFMDPRQFMLTLPYDPINVPLEPAEDNSVIPRMSLYESYLQSKISKSTTTTGNPKDLKKKRPQAVRKVPMFQMKRYNNYDYT
ncbi:trypsin epsilon-like [Plodia interpunctella]|uniref:trypsin epsilon-like n=1 Tax=Plodia interpunctella TaxID=58824 RepID=UPI00236820DF|nr:trypsin epsilon-like [Plodia interpunctella]